LPILRRAPPELGDLAGTGGEPGSPQKLLKAKSADEAMSIVNKPGVAYARSFGEANMRAASEDSAYLKLVEAEGKDRAKSIKALSVFLYWGGMTGNTVNCCKKRLLGIAPLKGLTAFSLLFFLYYGPLFFIVFAFNSLVIPGMRCAFGEASKTQVWFFKATGLILWTLSLFWIAPLGLLALVLSVCIPELRAQVEGQLEKELEMV